MASTGYVPGMAARPTFSHQIRLAIDASGKSRYRICKDLGVDQATLSRFMSGQRGLTLSVLDRLADLLDLRVTTGSPPARFKHRALRRIEK